MTIHARSDIHSSATVADDVDIGPGVVVGPNSVLSSGVQLGPNVIIGPNTTLREEVAVYPGAIIGTDPQDVKYDGSPTRCEIGPRTVIREYVTINRGTKASGVTIIGANCYLMAYCHIAHDCRIGNRVVMANIATFGGHCAVEDDVTLGAMAALHQFVRVGRLAMVGAISGLRTDAPPFMITFGPPPARVYGVNSVGLKRHGMKPAVRSRIKQAYKLLYRSGLNFAAACERIEQEIEPCPEIEHLLAFFATTKRGVSRGHDLESKADLDRVYRDELVRTVALTSGGAHRISESLGLG